MSVLRQSAGSLSVRRVPVSHLCSRLLDDQARADAEGGSTAGGATTRHSETQRRLPVSAVSFREETVTRHVGILTKVKGYLVIHFLALRFLFYCARVSWNLIS